MNYDCAVSAIVPDVADTSWIGRGATTSSSCGPTVQ